MRRLLATGAYAAATAAAVAFAGTAAVLCEPSPTAFARRNRVLGAAALPAAQRPHRWPLKGAKLAADPRVASLEATIAHYKAAGYDGLEMTTGARDLGGSRLSLPGRAA